MHKIFVATSSFSSHSEKPLALFRPNKFQITLNDKGRKLESDELINRLIDSYGVIAGTENYSKIVLNRLPKLKVISRVGIGLDNIDIKVAKQKGIKIFKTKTNLAPAVAELSLGLMIDIAHNISQSNQAMKSGKWEKQMGALLMGTTLGIIGLGRIGRELVQLSRSFRFKILAFDNKKDEVFAKENNVTYCKLDTLLKNSDFVSIHLNLSDETEYLINKEKIKLMKHGAILINTSRGKIIDETALYDALKFNKLGGAGLDVFEKEPYSGQLTELNNIVLTPHIGSYTKEIRVKMEIEAAENLIRGLNET